MGIIKNTVEKVEQSHDWTWTKILVAITLWVVASGLMLFMFGFMDFSMVKIAIALRLKFSQIFNLVLLYLPLVLFDLATPGKTFKELLNPNNQPLGKIAVGLFYGLLAIATSLVIVWGA